MRNLSKMRHKCRLRVLDPKFTSKINTKDNGNRFHQKLRRRTIAIGVWTKYCKTPLARLTLRRMGTFIPLYTPSIKTKENGNSDFTLHSFFKTIENGKVSFLIFLHTQTWRISIIKTKENGIQTSYYTHFFKTIENGKVSFLIFLHTQTWRIHSLPNGWMAEDALRTLMVTLSRSRRPWWTIDASFSHPYSYS